MYNFLIEITIKKEKEKDGRLRMKGTKKKDIEGMKDKVKGGQTDKDKDKSEGGLFCL